MTFTATGEPASIPPRILLELETDEAGGTFNTLTVSRDGVPIRLQPPTGVESTSTYDYEMPFGVPVQYAASGDYLPFVAPEWTENWASLAAWTEVQAGWALGAGDTITSSTYQAIITRSTSGTIQRVSVTDPSNVAFQIVTAASDLVALVSSESTGVTLSTSDGSGGAVEGSGSYTVSLVDGVVTVTADDASWSLEGTYSGTPTKIALVSLGGDFQPTGASFSASGDPDRIITGASGSIYTLDIAGKLVRKFNSSGVFQTSWSTTGVPTDIASDSSDNIYVTDRTTNIVRKFNSSGTPSTTWSTTGTPTGIGIDSADAVYVYDYSTDTIRKFSSSGTVITSWVNDVAADTNTYKSLAVLPGGSTIYTFADDDDDNTGQLTTYSSTGTLAASWTIPTVDDLNGVDTAGDFWIGMGKYAIATGSHLGSVSISPHIAGGLYPTSTLTTVLVGDKTDDTVRTFSMVDASIGAIEVTPAVAPVAFYELATATLTITEAWLIHPAQPTLSVSIDSGAWRDIGLNVDPATSQQLSAPSAVTLHQPVGRTRTVAIATGNRLEELWQLVLLAPTLDDRDDLRAIVRDQTPLLLRSPDSFNWDVPDGYYSIGDVASDRLTQNLTTAYRRITLPLTPSDPPVVRVASQRTWDDVIEQNATWNDVVLRYETWNDVLLGIS